MQVAPLWFAAQYTFNLSLSETTVTSNTILASTSSLFTYGLSCCLLLEAFLLSKLALHIPVHGRWDYCTRISMTAKARLTVPNSCEQASSSRGCCW